MRDMTRDELQDCLPDLLNGRLTAADAELVERAVATDPELAQELALLRAVRTAHRVAPTAINVAQIVGALPAAPAPAVAPLVDELALRRNAKRPAISLRFARAAALLVVVGGGTMVTVWSGRQPGSVSSTVRPSAESLAVNPSAVPQLGLGTSTDELSVEQLRALEADIRALDGVPAAEPEVATDLFAAEGA
jgi:anti-sigma factor RsiW